MSNETETTLNSTEKPTSATEVNPLPWLTHGACLIGGIIPFGIFLAPLAIYFAKKEDDSIRREAAKACNFQVCGVAAILVCWALISGSFLMSQMMSVGVFSSLIGFVVYLPTLVTLTFIGFGCNAAYQKYLGNEVRYPFALKLFK